jgi:hypothetical protein
LVILGARSGELEAIGVYANEYEIENKVGGAGRILCYRLEDSTGL